MTSAQFTRTPSGGQTIEYDTTGYSGPTSFDEPASDPRPLPTEAWLRGRAEALQGTRSLRRALLAERGIRASTALRYGIGWDPKREVWVLPVRSEWGLVNVRYRPRRGDDRDPWSIKGRGVKNGCLPLWPWVPFWDPWVLCAGEWDALAVLQADLPGVTGLCGCTWKEEWNADARRKRVAVMYDVGEQRRAAVTTERLRCVGAYSAWTVTLDGPNGYDPSDFFLEGGTRKELLRRIREAKLRQRP